MENQETTNSQAEGHKIVTTYAGEMAKVIEGSQGGLIKKIIEEQEEEEAENKILSPKSRINNLYLILGILFLILAFGILVFLGVFNKKIGTVDVPKQATPLIFIDQNYFQEVAGFNKDQIAQSVLNEVNDTTVKSGGVEGIYLTENKNVIGLNEFTKLIKGNLNVSGLKYLSDGFLMGAFNGENKNLFILLKMRSMADVFDGLRAWESKMFSDLYPFFGVSLNSTNKYLLTKDFEDGTIINKNARILKDNTGNIVLMYVYADDQSVIITSSDSAAAEVIARLSGSQVEK